MSQVDPTTARRTFGQAADFFVSTVAAVRPEQWEQVGLGRWTVRDLVGHTSRALSTVETYLERPAPAADVPSPEDYFTTMRTAYGDPEQVLQRGREAGARLGPDPRTAVRNLAGRLLSRLAEVEDGQLLTTPAGGMRLESYLPTRTFELVVHSLDLAAAIGVAPSPPAEALAESLLLAANLSLLRGQGAEVLLALTGRDPLPPGFSVL
jgi:uncharacterized protein (TIGR03083 family)